MTNLTGVLKISGGGVFAVIGETRQAVAGHRLCNHLIVPVLTFLP